MRVLFKEPTKLMKGSGTSEFSNRSSLAASARSFARRYGFTTVEFSDTTTTTTKKKTKARSKKNKNTGVINPGTSANNIGGIINNNSNIDQTSPVTPMSVNQ